MQPHKTSTWDDKFVTFLKDLKKCFTQNRESTQSVTEYFRLKEEKHYNKGQHFTNNDNAMKINW